MKIDTQDMVYQLEILYKVCKRFEGKEREAKGIMMAIQLIKEIEAKHSKPVRKIQYYGDAPDKVWCYFTAGTINPCKCGSNCYQHQYDGKNIICVCNACTADIYSIKEEYIKDELNKGIWR